MTASLCCTGQATGVEELAALPKGGVRVQTNVETPKGCPDGDRLLPKTRRALALSSSEDESSSGSTSLSKYHGTVLHKRQSYCLYTGAETGQVLQVAGE